MEYGTVPESRFQEVIEFLRNTFPDEPLNLAVGLCKKGVPCELLEKDDLQTLRHELSVLATDPLTGQIVGVVLNGILKSGEIEEALESMKTIENREYHLIYELLLGLNKEADLFNRYGVDKIFELRILTVDEKYRGKGIAKQLFLRSELIAEDHGFKLMKVDATSFFTQKIAESMGMKTEKEVKYKDIRDKQGRRDYAKVESPHDHYKIMIKDLSKKK